MGFLIFAILIISSNSKPLSSEKVAFFPALEKVWHGKPPHIISISGILLGSIVLTLAAAVSNAGGLGVVGGLGWTPKFMKEELRQLKEELNNANTPFGVDLALPKVSKL